jgi:HEAT repeat protein
MCAGVCAQAQVTVQDSQGRTLRGLAGSDTLVTVVLNVGGARDANLQIIEVFSKHFTFVQQNGKRGSYNFDSVKEIRVQRESVQARRFSLNRAGMLSPSERDVAERAGARAFEIFSGSAGNQELRMAAASLVAVSEHESAANALAYLRKLASVNDESTAILASLSLYDAGQVPDEKTIRNGLVSGNKTTRAVASVLAGLVGDPVHAREITSLLSDPTALVSAAAIRAAARLGDRSGIEIMIRGIRSRDTIKADASYDALKRLGGPDVIEALREILHSERGQAWFRALAILFALEDEEAIKLMSAEALKNPEYAVDAAILLSGRDDWEAITFLREYIKQDYDAYYEDLAKRLTALEALIKADFMPAKNLMAALMNLSSRDVMVRGTAAMAAFQKEATIMGMKLLGCSKVGVIGSGNLMAIVAPLIEDLNPIVALVACSAAIAIADPEYHERFVDRAEDFNVTGRFVGR